MSDEETLRKVLKDVQRLIMISPAVMNTIWHSNHITLYDYIENTLANTKPKEKDDEAMTEREIKDMQSNIEKLKAALRDVLEDAMNCWDNVPYRTRPAKDVYSKEIALSGMGDENE